MIDSYCTAEVHRGGHERHAIRDFKGLSDTRSQWHRDVRHLSGSRSPAGSETSESETAGVNETIKVRGIKGVVVGGHTKVTSSRSSCSSRKP